jgi:hypothetical protein
VTTTGSDVQGKAASLAQLSRKTIKMTDAEREAKKKLARERVVRAKGQRLISEGLAVLESLDRKSTS